ncbi:GNAT family N-acetyltransferase [Candidatus Ulvibacter alkanivorans]|uniref:GNAT family N-acetyltransferase n=1 Tax=Candidatus Ulvibacter alkanivorans TaxID=2267620 RepID=UPI000DF346F7|nr:GNAT family N-acetyltransferase [Candidatus Ulvibacter alkanivorans]
MIHYVRVTNPEELQQILELQQENLPTALSSEEKQQEGFVTVHHTLDLLTRMNERCAHILAKDGDTVVGYALCMHKDFGEEIEILKPMIQEIERVIALDDTINNYIIMGQICIAKAYRGQGIFRKLYEMMRIAVIPKFETIITEVDTDNRRSLAAHNAIGFKTLSRYRAEGKNWWLIYLN